MSQDIDRQYRKALFGAVLSQNIDDKIEHTNLAHFAANMGLAEITASPAGPWFPKVRAVWENRLEWIHAMRTSLEEGIKGTTE